MDLGNLVAPPLLKKSEQNLVTSDSLESLDPHYVDDTKSMQHRLRYGLNNKLSLESFSIQVRRNSENRASLGFHGARRSL